MNGNIASSEEICWDLEENLKNWNQVVAENGIEMNKNKIKVMAVSNEKDNKEIRVEGN